MIYASEAIPENGIFLVDAFLYVFHIMTPNWLDLKELACQPHLHGRERPEDLQRADADYDRAQLEANQWLRDRIGDRSITARICDRHGQVQRLTCEGWENAGFLRTGIDENFVSPDDPTNPGPDTTIDGVRYPVFFLRSEFEKLVETAFGVQLPLPPLSGEPIQPRAVEVLPEPDRLQPKAWLAKARKDHPQSRNEKPIVYARRLYPLMQKADVTKVWKFRTLQRRLND
jgi:hypothetical protein